MATTHTPDPTAEFDRMTRIAAAQMPLALDGDAAAEVAMLAATVRALEIADAHLTPGMRAELDLLVDGVSL